MEQPPYGYVMVGGEPPPPYMAESKPTSLLLISPTVVITVHIIFTGTSSASNQTEEQPQANPESAHKVVLKHPVVRAVPFVAPGRHIIDCDEEFDRASPEPSIEEQRTVQMNDLLGVSIITFLCCSPLFGIIAVAFSCATRNALRRGAVMEARRRHRVALAANACGIMLGVLAALVFVFANTLEMSSFRRGALFWVNSAPSGVRDSIMTENR